MYLREKITNYITKHNFIAPIDIQIVLCHLISTDDRNVLLERNEEGQLDRSCGKYRSVTDREERNILQTVERRKANWICHI
jgi:hypothetical protein